MSVDDRGVSIVELVVAALAGVVACVVGLAVGRVGLAPLGWPILILGLLVVGVSTLALAIRLGIHQPPR